MRHIITLLLLLTMLVGATAAMARGTNDDCPPGSKDPDCVTSTPGK